MTAAPTDPRPARSVASRTSVTLLALLGFAGYAWVGVTQYVRGFAGNYDLGIFTQAAKGWVSAGTPIAPIKGGSLFADHFSPITALFGLAYAVWSDPRALILTQSLSLALAVLLVGFHARAHLPRGRALVVMGSVAVGVPFVAAARFDVHETGLGAAIFAGFFLSVRAGALTPTLLWALAALTIKEDVGPIVVMAGVAWWLIRRDARGAFALAALGLAGLALATFVIGANAEVVSPYSSYLLSGEADWSLARWQPALLFLAMSGFGWREPMALLALPTLAWRALASAPNVWSVTYHYDVPLAVLAAIVLVDRLRTARGWAGARTFGLAGVSPILGLVLATGLTPWRAHPFQSPYAAAPLAALTQHIPAGDAVLADQHLGVLLVPHFEVRMLSTTDRPGTLQLTAPAAARWVVLNPGEHTWGAPRCAKTQWLRSVSYPRWTSGSFVLVDQGSPKVPALQPCQG